MRQAYGLIAVLLATTAVVAIILHNTNRAAENRALQQQAEAPGAAPAPAQLSSLPGPAPEASSSVTETAATPAAEAQPPSLPDPALDSSGVAVEMADLQATLAEREVERERLTASLGEKETVLAARDAQVEEIEAQLIARTAEVKVLEAEIAVLSARSSFETELQQARASRALYPVTPAGTGVGTDSLEAALIDRKGPPPNPEALTTAALETASEPAPVPYEPPAIPSIFAAIHFETASADLTPGGKERVRAAAAALTGVPIAGVDVVGYTDTVGSREANHRLATRRADSVAVALAEAGLSRDLIVASGLGEEGAPVATGRGVSEPLNRSVEIVVRPVQAQP